MRIAIGSDHRGFALKGKLVDLLRRLGHDALDVGAPNADSSDYPDYAEAVATRVAHGEVERGILVCGSGIGMAIAANKVPGVRAAACHDEITAEMCRRHNDVNVLCLSADMLGEKIVDNLVKTWLTTPFEGGRHARRVEKIAALETRFSRCQGHGPPSGGHAP
jgi:ribose 5-phosphate isomerase B